MKDGKKKIEEVECSYHKHWNWYNHAGYLPCGECNSCKAEKEYLERLHKWNAATEAGAKPNR